MKQSKVVVALCCSLLLTACDKTEQLKAENIKLAKQKVESRLSDPGSVQYQNVKAYSDETVCGEYNTKNKMGGYEGFQPFVVVLNTLSRIGNNSITKASPITGLPLDEAETRTATTYWCNDNPDKRYSWLARECEFNTRYAQLFSQQRLIQLRGEESILRGQEEVDRTLKNLVRDLATISSGRPPDGSGGDSISLSASQTAKRERIISENLAEQQLAQQDCDKANQEKAKLQTGK